MNQAGGEVEGLSGKTWRDGVEPQGEDTGPGDIPLNEKGEALASSPDRK